MAEYRDVTYIKKQIADCKRAIQSSNSDYLTGYVSALSATEGVIAETPAADVVEVRHGEWKMRGGVPRCSECDEKALQKDEGGTGGFSHEYVRVKSSYCPNCGAKMDGKGG